MTGENIPDLPIKALEERIKGLTTESDYLRKAVEGYEQRLRHLLKSKTVQLFDEYDYKTGTYKRDIQRLDTYGVDKKVLEFEAQNSIKAKPATIPTYNDPITEWTEARPCEVDGRPARFHRWIEVGKLFVRFPIVKGYEKEILSRDYEEKGLIPPGASFDTFHEIVALVEYKDGTVHKVEPEKVKFTDRRATE